LQLLAGGRLAAFSAAILSSISFIIPTRRATKVNYR
jgi:hypothetical protein